MKQNHGRTQSFLLALVDDVVNRQIMYMKLKKGLGFQHSFLCADMFLPDLVGHVVSRLIKFICDRFLM
jgi:hypothetical protein